jgi:hypothetical protein
MKEFVIKVNNFDNKLNAYIYKMKKFTKNMRESFCYIVFHI